MGLGENITFTLSVKNATKVLMYIDGSVNRRFENITPDMMEYTFTMAFSSLGTTGASVPLRSKPTTAQSAATRPPQPPFP